MAPIPSNPDDLIRRSIAPDDQPELSKSLALLAQAQKGDRSALEELVRRYQDRLQRIVRIHMGGSALRRHYDSMDFVQSTFRAALPRISELQPRSASSLLHWLSLIAMNQIRDAYDHQRAAKRDVQRHESLTEAAMVLASSRHQPAERVQLAEVRELLDDAVSKLPEDQRRVVVLRDYCGETWERISLELARDCGAARQLHQRAWIRLRQDLRPKLEGRG